MGYVQVAYSKKIDTQESLVHVTFFPLERFGRFFFFRSRLKNDKLLTFDNLFPPLQLLKPAVD